METTAQVGDISIQPSPNISPISPPPPTQPPLPHKKTVFIIVGLLLVMLIIATVSFFISLNNKQAVVSGKIDLNGYVPAGSTIAIAQRKAGESEYHTVITGLPPIDQTPWEWKGAQKGEIYEMRAYLQTAGQPQAESEPKILAAPATEEVLTLNTIHKPETPTKTDISGMFDLNGYVPVGSSIDIVEKKPMETEYNIIIKGLPAVDKTAWIWNDAEVGEKYDFRAILVQGNILLAESAVKTFTAPAANESLTINSTLISPTLSPSPTSTTPTNIPLIQPTNTPVVTTYPTSTPPLSSATISGNVDLNGAIPSNALISVQTKQTGTGQFKIVVDQLTARNGVFWSWGDAKTGVSYQIQANLFVNGQLISQSQVLTVAAPAANEILVINSANNLPQPSNSPGVNCNQPNSSNNWSVNISYGSMNNTKLYWIKVGDINQENRFIDARIPPNNQGLPTTYNFNTEYFFAQGVTYYAKYAYATCDNCTDPYYFSPFSKVAQFSCNPPGPTNTPSPSPLPTITKTPTETPFPFTPMPTQAPTNTPVPTNTPTLEPTVTLEPTDSPPTN